MFGRKPKTPTPEPRTVDHYTLNNYVTCTTCGHLTLYAKAKTVEVYYDPAYHWSKAMRPEQQYEFYCPNDKPIFDRVIYGAPGADTHYRRVEASWEEVKTPTIPALSAEEHSKEKQRSLRELHLAQVLAEKGVTKATTWEESADADLITAVVRALEVGGAPELAIAIRGRKLQPKTTRAKKARKGRPTG